MPTLNWIGKDAVVNHHHHVPFNLLKDVPDLSTGEPLPRERVPNTPLNAANKRNRLG